MTTKLTPKERASIVKRARAIQVAVNNVRELRSAFARIAAHANQDAQRIQEKADESTVKTFMAMAGPLTGCVPPPVHVRHAVERLKAAEEAAAMRKHTGQDESTL